MQRIVLGAMACAGLLGCVLVGCGGDDAASASSSGEPSSSSGSSGGSSSGGGSSGSTSSSGGRGTSSSSGGSSSGGSSSGGASSSGGPAAAPWLVQCFYGAAIAGFDASNPDIEAACESLPYTKVRTCAEADCQIGWPFLQRDAAYNGLFAALDSNGDERVDDDDAQVSIALLGHSWGGTNVAEVAGKLADDDRVAVSRKAIKLAVVWDPYRPGFDLRPRANVERFVVLRQSLTPPGDCSENVGSFKGLAPRCPAAQGCEDYNYSASPNDQFPAYPQGSMRGNQVGHCDVVNVGFPVAKALLEGGAPTLPASVPVVAP